MNDITERAERGAALLDEKRPGWWRVIDLERLDIRTGCDCVAGQIGGYGRVMDSLGIGHSAEAVFFGFDVGAPDPDLPMATIAREVGGEYDALTAAWRELIEARRAGASVTA